MTRLTDLLQMSFRLAVGVAIGLPAAAPAFASNHCPAALDPVIEEAVIKDLISLRTRITRASTEVERTLLLKAFKEKREGGSQTLPSGFLSRLADRLHAAVHDRTSEESAQLEAQERANAREMIEMKWNRQKSQALAPYDVFHGMIDSQHALLSTNMTWIAGIHRGPVIYDLRSGQFEPLQAPNSPGMPHAALTSHRLKAAIIVGDRTVSIFDVGSKDWKSVPLTPPSFADARRAKLTKDGYHVVVEDDKTLRLIDLRARKIVLETAQWGIPGRHVEVSPNGRYAIFVPASPGSSPHFFDLKSGKRIRFPHLIDEEYHLSIIDTVFSADSRMLYAATSHGPVFKIDIQKMKWWNPSRYIKGSTQIFGYVYAKKIEWSPNGLHLIAEIDSPNSLKMNLLAVDPNTGSSEPIEGLGPFEKDMRIYLFPQQGRALAFRPRKNEDPLLHVVDLDKKEAYTYRTSNVLHLENAVLSDVTEGREALIGFHKDHLAELE